jgi:L-ascorbate metabolism protein UlaG (beta-lactamase superfamily)
VPLPGLTFLGHATMLIELGGLRVLTDPILVDRLMFLTRVVRPLDPSLYAAVDVVLLSHLHLDHFDRLSLARL